MAKMIRVFYIFNNPTVQKKVCCHTQWLFSCCDCQKVWII